MNKKKYIVFGFAAFTLSFLFTAPLFASNDNTVCAVYISGIGCGSCAVADPVLFTEATQNNPNLFIIEYEIYKLRPQNTETKDAYFRTYIPWRKPGIPLLVLNKERVAIGKFQVLKAANALATIRSNPCPSREGLSTDFENLDVARLPGKFNIWTKNRVLISGKGGDSGVLRKVLLEKDMSKALSGIAFKEIEPIAVPISKAKINFQYAVMIGSWRLQWNGKAVKISRGFGLSEDTVCRILILVIFLALVGFLVRVRKAERGFTISLKVGRKRRDAAVTCLAAMLLIYFFMVARGISPDFLQESGYEMPLAVFTLLIALVDGFNPCNMFVLTCLLVLLISTSDSKKRLYTVALSFVCVVFVIYFLFMAAWLNVFKYVGFVTPLRVAIAIIAIVAGLINCKELLFFRKGITLTIQDKHKGPLMRKIDAMKEIIINGSFPLLVSSSVGLAALASLVELPCTAGFPIIYTAVLIGRGLEKTVGYYLYLVFYNVIYVVPLLAIISIFIYTFKGRQITQRQVQIMKFIGGIIMIILGVVLLVNPGLIGLGLG